MNCTACVELGEIMVIQFTVIDPSVFRHIQLTLIMHLTVRIKNQMLIQSMQNVLAIRILSLARRERCTSGIQTQIEICTDL